jgi:hypothetical protein
MYKEFNSPTGELIVYNYNSCVLKPLKQHIYLYEDLPYFFEALKTSTLVLNVLQHRALDGEFRKQFCE